MKQARKLLALLLALATVCSTLSVTAWAADVEETGEPDTIVGEENSDDTNDTSNDAIVGSGDPDAPDDNGDPTDITDETPHNAPVGSGDLDAPEGDDAQTPDNAPVGSGDPDALDDNGEATDVTPETDVGNGLDRSEAEGDDAQAPDAPETDDETPAAPAKAPAKAPIASGTCGENLTWVFDEEIGTLTISGTGEMTDFFMVNGEKMRRISPRNPRGLYGERTKITTGTPPFGEVPVNAVAAGNAVSRRVPPPQD